jgi:KDO2-lipid IV(A) lauroyltransferase
MQQQAEPAQNRLAAQQSPPKGSLIRRWAANFWLDFFYFHARYTPWVARWAKGFFLWWAWGCSRHIRTVIQTNARWLLGPEATRQDRKALAKRVLGSFYDFIYDVGRTNRMSREELKALIVSVEGQDHYDHARSLGKGAIIATAHMGSFELGMCAMLEIERGIHVVFQRDPFSNFERLRSDFRKRLGIQEAAVNDGWATWLRLRDALAANEVVAIQADRVMPGQKGVKVPFLGGHTLFPEGPAKLAAITGAPIIPIFTIRQRDGRVRVCIDEPIMVSGADPIAIQEAIAKLAATVGRYVKTYPDQWLVMHRAWCEDIEQPASSEGCGVQENA